MATSYPSNLANPLISGFGITVASGALRSTMPGSQVQRRAFDTMPHTFRLAFSMSVTDWADWQAWVALNAHDWFNMDLPSMYAGKVATLTTPTLIRFISPITAAIMSAEHVQLSVSAEIAPSMIARYREVA